MSSERAEASGRASRTVQRGASRGGRLAAWLVVSAVLAGCGAPGLGSGPLGAASADRASLGGLMPDVAAHPSVQLARPHAFTLTAESRPFLEALERRVGPQRKLLAERLTADATVSRGITGWSRATMDAKLATLTRAAELEAAVMGCPVPAIQRRTPTAGDAELMAVYEPALGASDAGTITLYTTTLAKQSGVVALSVVVHEMRHAAQHALTVAAPAGREADDEVLVRGYAAGFDLVRELGGQDDLSYGDYAHLTVEHDAFQTGNQVAALVSGSASHLGFGFVDVAFDGRAMPVFDVLARPDLAPGVPLITAVNQAQAEALRLGTGRFTSQRPGRRTGPQPRGGSVAWR